MGTAADRIEDFAALMAELANPFALRRAVLHRNAYWPRPPADADLHSVLVTGVERDANGNITAVYINDTALGACMMRVPIDVWNRARRDPDGSNRDVVVTTRPVFQ